MEPEALFEDEDVDDEQAQPCGVPTRGEKQPCGVPSGGKEPLGASASGDEQAAVDKLNSLRAQEGLSALAWDPASRLQKAARVRASEIARQFSHTRPDGRDSASVLDDLGLSYRSTGENIAYGTKLGPSGVIRLWEKSPGHRRNMLDRDYREVGLAAWQGPHGNVYWVQVFLLR